MTEENHTKGSHTILNTVIRVNSLIIKVLTRRSTMQNNMENESESFIAAVVQKCSNIGVLSNFTKFTGKHLYQSLFLIKFRPDFIKKRL